MDKPYSKFSDNYDTLSNNNYTEIENHYNNLGLEFIILFFIGGSIFYNIYYIFKGKMSNCCFKRKLKQKTLKKKLLDECSICLAEMKEKDKVIILECNHIYHKDCIMIWFQKNNINCPLCRKSLFN